MTRMSNDPTETHPKGAMNGGRGVYRLFLKLDGHE